MNRSLIAGALLALMASSAQAAPIVWDFSGFMDGPHHDTFGNVTGTKGYGKLGGQVFTGSVTIETDLMPGNGKPDSSSRADYSGAGSWLNISINGFNIPKAEDLGRAMWMDEGRVQVGNESTGDYASFHTRQLDADFCAASGTFCSSFDLRLKSFADWLDNDSIGEDFTWSDEVFTDYANYGQLEFSYKFIDHGKLVASAGGKLKLTEFTLVPTADCDPIVVSPSEVPEPAMLGLLGLGLAGLGLSRRRG